MSSDRLGRAFGLFFVLGFFAFLFGPLIIMSVSAFNSSAFPRVSPWECFTVEWFVQLADNGRLLTGLRNSLFIGLGVVLVSVPLGLAGAMLLTRVSDRVRPWYYTIVVSPILVPGVVLGISTLLFWDRLGSMFGASRDSIFYDGFFLTIVGQSTFISAYTMLVFISRLQRFETVQEEAALDLGATHWQSFRKILLPFLAPAVASASVLAFLASFENYNTTVFTAISTSTLTKELASKVRYGIDPSISALAVCIIVITLTGAALHEILKRRELAAARFRDEAARLAEKELELGIATFGQADDPVPSFKASSPAKSLAPWYQDPAILIMAFVVIAGTGTTLMAGTVGVEECKAQVKAQKQESTQLRIEALRERNRVKAEQKALEREKNGSNQDTESTPVDRSATPPAGERPGTSNFGDVFGGGNLTPGGESAEEPEQTDEPVVPPAGERPGTSNFGDVFGGGNLGPGSGD